MKVITYWDDLEVDLITILKWKTVIVGEIWIRLMWLRKGTNWEPLKDSNKLSASREGWKFL
jgi:hypothetical protein